MQRFERPSTRDEFLALEWALSRSVIARAERVLQRRVTSAFAQSRSHAAGRRVVESFRALPAPARVQLSGHALAAFIAVHVAWRVAMPSGVSPALPMLAWAWLGLLAATFIIAPGPLVRAWRAHRDLRTR